MKWIYKGCPKHGPYPYVNNNECPRCREDKKKENGKPKSHMKLTDKTLKEILSRKTDFPTRR
jgi:hypothetical protein